MKKCSRLYVSLSAEQAVSLERLEMRRMLHDGEHHDHGAETMPLDDGHNYDEVSYAPESLRDPGGDFNLGPKWGSSSVTYGYSNLFASLTSDMTNRQIRDSINEALLVWSAVSPLRFTEVADPGGTVNDSAHSVESPQIRIGAHFIDGASGSNVLAHAYYPGSGRGGDLHFDSGNTYNLSGAEYFIETAAHEIGHAIGLDHANGDVSGGSCPTPKPAIMDACIQGRYGEPGDAYLLSDDIAGVQSHYGAGLGYVLETGGNMYVSGTQGNNTINVSVSGTTLTVESVGFGSFSRSTTGINSITVYGRGGSDTVWVYNVPSTLSLNIYGAGGNDVVQIGDANYDNNILGNVVIDLGDGTDEIVVNDITDEVGSDTFTLDTGFIFRKVTGGEINTNANTETFSLVASPNNDIINVLSVPAGVNFVLNGWSGNDVFNIGNGDYDTNIAGSISVSGFNGVDTMNILDASDTLADSHSLDSNTYSKSSTTDAVTYGALEIINITASSADYANIFNLTGGPTDGIVNVDAGDGDDVFNVGGNDIDTNAVNTTFNLDGQLGSDVLNYNDGSDVGDTDVYTIIANQILKIGGGVTTAVNLTSVSEQVINASNGATQINGNEIGRFTTINGGGGDDTIDLDDNYTLTLFPGPIVLQYATVVNTGTGNDNLLLNNDGTGNPAWASFDQNETLGSLNIGVDGLLTMVANGFRHLSVEGATINGKLNLTDNMFIRRALNTSASTFYRDRLRNGYNNGAWNGLTEPAIYSSGTTGAAGNSTRALGYALKSEAPNVVALGTVINPDDLIIRLTQKGDTDLDRDVDFDDLLRVAQNYGEATGNYWYQGDFDYDGDVDFDNLLSQAQRYGLGYALVESTAAPRQSVMSSLDEDANDLLIA